jgi:hypothetical protein
MTETANSTKLAVALDYAMEWGLFLPQILTGYMWKQRDLVVVGYDILTTPPSFFEEAAVCPYDLVELFTEIGADRVPSASLRRRRYSPTPPSPPDMETARMNALPASWWRAIPEEKIPDRLDNPLLS